MPAAAPGSARAPEGTAPPPPGRRTRPTAPYPQVALEWLVGARPLRVLDLGSGAGGLAAMLAGAGHEVFCLDSDPGRMESLAARLATRLHVVGQVESLPYLSCHFDVVTAGDNLHRFAPGLAVTEIARVLKPGGYLGVLYNTRDATVPWVKRLMSLVQRVDPEAMRGDVGTGSVASVTDSPYFAQVEQRDFRNWLPVTRSGLVQMVERRPAVADLDRGTRKALLAEVGALYDASARVPDPLMLPFRTSCWRAYVDHSQLALPELDDALEIPLRGLPGR